MIKLPEITELSIFESDKGIPTVNGRQLWLLLKVKKDYSNWIKDRIIKYSFIEDKDYTKCSPFLASGSDGGQNKIEYYLTITMAKELAMVQNNAQGKIYRMQLLEIEQAWKNQCSLENNSQLAINNKIFSDQIIQLNDKLNAILSSFNNLPAISQTTEINLLVNDICRNINSIKSIEHNNKYCWDRLYSKFTELYPNINLQDFKRIYKQGAIIRNIRDVDILNKLLQISIDIVNDEKEYRKSKMVSIKNIWDD